MIFATIGTQGAQFIRFLESIDALIETCNIKEEVIVQIGCTEYSPKHFKTIKFLSEIEFNMMIDKSSIVITHAGSGSLFNAIKSGKKVIAVARLSMYGEMIDDHQNELVKKLVEEGYIIDGTYSLIDAWEKMPKFLPKNNNFTNIIKENLRIYLNNVLNK